MDKPQTSALPVFHTLPPLALYVHIPWCVRKCPYCDFNSHAITTDLPEVEYCAAVLADLESALPQIWGRSVQSIFFGGGTPSLFSVEAIESLIAGIRARLTIAPAAEITLEANPGAIEAAKFPGLRQAGVTRLSIGVQSFTSHHLTALGRIHSADEAARAIELALAHFEHVNIDLMFALPQQQLLDAHRDIQRGIGYGLTHISAYQLTLEPNTAFHHQPPLLPDDDTAADMQDLVEEALAAAGFDHYETSAYAKRGAHCRHNLNYWQFGDYLGIGAGAHSKISFPDRVIRNVRHKHPQHYMTSANRISRHEEVDRADLPLEFMMNALRLTAGFSPSLFSERTGLAFSHVLQPLQALQDEGLLEISPTLIRPTARGRRFLNRMLTAFIAEP